MKLYDILKEIQGKSKAIILAGAPGAGKGYILRGLDLGSLKTLNVDDIYVPMLKKANITLDLKNATPEERSNQAKAMAAANKEFKANLDSTIGNKESFVLDGTGASFNQTSKLKDQLEKAGYQVFMLYVYTDLERSLKQNQDRYEKSGGKDRSLAPGIVMKTWKDVTQNYKPYKNLSFNIVFICSAFLALRASERACCLGVLGLVPLGLKGLRYVFIISSKSEIF